MVGRRILPVTRAGRQIIKKAHAVAKRHELFLKAYALQKTCPRIQPLLASLSRASFLTSLESGAKLPVHPVQPQRLPAPRVSRNIRSF